MLRNFSNITRHDSCIINALMYKYIKYNAISTNDILDYTVVDDIRGFGGSN